MKIISRIFIAAIITLVQHSFIVAQTFINGDFEKHTATICDYNLSDDSFNSKISNVFAFGSKIPGIGFSGEMDYQTSGCYLPNAYHGNWCLGLATTLPHGNSGDAVAIELSSPLVIGKQYTVSFAVYGNYNDFSPAEAKFDIGESFNNSDVGKVINTITAQNGKWSNIVFTFTASQASRFITVRILPVNDAWAQIDDFKFISNKFQTFTDTLCTNEPFFFSMPEIVTVALSCIWEFPGATPAISTEKDPKNIFYPSPGIYPVKLIRTLFSSIDTIHGEITVYPVPVAQAGDDTVLCLGTSISLGTAAVEGNTYSWTPANGLNDPNIANPVATPANVLTKYFVRVTNTFGCSSVDSIVISTVKDPVIVTKDTSLCMGESAEIRAFSDQADVTYSWTPADGLSQTDIQNPVVTAFKNRDYFVTVTNATGCSATKKISVSVKTLNANLQAEKEALGPDETTSVKFLLKQENFLKGITSFKATVTYDMKVFQFTQQSQKFLKGTDNTWEITAKQVNGELLIAAHGQTPITEVELGFELTAYLAKQLDDNILLKLTEINGGNFIEESCDAFQIKGTKILLKPVCAGDMRLVNIGEFQTQLQQVTPNPVSEETAEFEYSVGVEGDIIIEIYNQRGELLKTLLKAKQKPGIFKERIDAKELPAGAYLIKLSTLQLTKTKMFVIVR
ncbi:MAG: T9SS type A sorting domain-containing protein [Bacteroidota bacterium]